MKRSIAPVFDTEQTFRRPRGIVMLCPRSRVAACEHRSGNGALSMIAASAIIRGPHQKVADIMLRRLAWSSFLSPSFSVAHLNDIIAPSRRNNERNHISGMLLFTGAHFLGILEGDEWDLDNLWVRLERDPRHCDLIRIGNALCGERWFPQWTMAYTDHAQVSAQIETLRSPQAWIAAKWAEMIRPIMLHADSM